MREIRDIAKLIEDYGSFQEAIIDHMEWRHYATEIAILLNLITESDGAVRRNLETPHHMMLVFGLVRSFHLQGGMTPMMEKEIMQIDWGINEIALIRYDAQDGQLRVSGEHLPVNHCIQFLWEGRRQISIEFGTLTVADHWQLDSIPHTWKQSTRA